MYTGIVVGSDGSDTAERAVAQAAALAASDGARLVIVTAYVPGEGPTADVQVDAVPDDIRFVLTDRVQAEELGARSRAAAQEAGAERLSVQAIEGDAADVLIEAARDFNADLIVVGSVGLGRTGHFILGSVASSVVHHAPCDVLVAHTG